MSRYHKFQCEDCGDIFRVEAVDVFENGTVKPDGKYTMRGDHWFDENGNQVPETTEMYRIDGRIVDEPYCQCGEASMARQYMAPSFASDASRMTDAVTGSLMKENNLTNINDSLRIGDTAAPKLAPPLQQAADNMFARKQDFNTTIAGVKGLPYDQSGRRGMSMLQSALKEGRKL